MIAMIVSYIHVYYHYGSFIYDVHKKIRFLTPLSCPRASTWATPLITHFVDAHMRSTWNTHRSLEAASIPWPSGPQAEIGI